ncbi:MAG: glycoside hydrolase [Phreatobacter sp.]
MTELAAYLNGINGQPYREDRHCLVLAAEIQERFFGRLLPLAALPKAPSARHALIHTNPVRASWRLVDTPRHGAVVLMSPRAANRIDCHIGTCLLMPEPLIVHTDRPQGVCVDDLMVLGARGWHPTFWMPEQA